MTIRLSPLAILFAAGTIISCSSSPSVAPSPLGASPIGALNTQHEHHPGTPDNPGAPGTPGMPGMPAPTEISIVGTFGPQAFMPNPLQASVGAMIAFKNADAVTHDIVVSDGTPAGTIAVGAIAPGATSGQVHMAAPALTYHCTLHPSMTGTIVDAAAAPPAMPPPDTMPPPYYPPDDDYEY